MAFTRPPQGTFFLPETGLIGIDEIDSDHLEIVAALETLRAQLVDDTSACMKGFAALVQQLAGHFHREEVLMRAAGYPQADGHAYHHEQALSKLHDVNAEVEKAGEFRISDLRDIYKLLMDDIFPADLRYHEFLVAKGHLK